MPAWVLACSFPFENLERLPISFPFEELEYVAYFKGHQETLNQWNRKRNLFFSVWNHFNECFHVCDRRKDARMTNMAYWTKTRPILYPISTKCVESWNAMYWMIHFSHVTYTTQDIGGLQRWFGRIYTQISLLKLFYFILFKDTKGFI